MTKPAIGVIGLGLMGHGIGKNILAQGFPVAVYDIDPAAVERQVRLGATSVRSPQDLAERSDVVITVLPNGPQVEEVVTGPNGLLKRAKPGLLLMDCSTIDPEVTDRLRAALVNSGCRMVDAAMTLGPQQAEDGRLIMLVGATDEDYAVVRPVLAAISQKIIRAGGPGAGIRLKLVNNLLMLSIFVADVEAIAMGAKAGLSTEVMLDLLTSTAADNFHLRNSVSNQVLRRSYQPGFKLALAHKDLGLALNMAARDGVPLFTLGMARHLFSTALNQGKGDLSCFAVAEVLEQLTDVLLAPEATSK